MSDSPEAIELRRVFGPGGLCVRRGFHVLGRILGEQKGDDILAQDSASICREAEMRRRRVWRAR